MPERLWQMRRLGPGDWLLPSNDQQTLWRLQLIEEWDGLLTRGDGSVVNGDYWSAFRCRYDMPTIEREHPDLSWSEAWVECRSMMRTRQEAIDYCLSQEPATT